MDELDKLRSHIIERALNGEDQNKLLELTVRTLSDRVIQSFQVDGDFTTPDAEMLTRLVRDTWSFGAAKNYQQTRDLTLALTDDKGKLREFDEFKKIAEGITDKYNQTWLRTEYDFAVSASQNAARWTEFEREGDVIPNLQYQTVGDEHVRAAHQALDGIIRPLKDLFWDTHYPPNGWGCRCEVIQSLAGADKVTPSSSIPQVAIPPLFETNLSKTGLIYPKNHPYYVDVPRAEMRKSLAYLPADNAYIDMLVGDNTIHIHPLHGEGELHNNLIVANDFMNLKKEVKSLNLLPDIHVKDAHLKERFLPNGYKLRDLRKNPDALIQLKNGDKWVADFKCLDGKGGHLAHHIKDAYAKADYVIVKLENSSKTIGQIMRTVNGQMEELDDLKGIVIIDSDGSLIYEKFR